MARAKKAEMSRGEFETAVSELSAAMRTVNTNITQLGKARQTLEEKFAANRAAAEETINARWKDVCAYAESHRSDLVGDAKSTEIMGTIIGWRTNPPSVKIDPKVGEDAVITNIRNAGLEDELLRLEVGLNKQAMLNDPNTALRIKGVSILTDEEDFFVKLPDADFEKRKKVPSRAPKPRSRAAELAKSGTAGDGFVVARDEDAKKMRPTRKRA